MSLLFQDIKGNEELWVGNGTDARRFAFVCVRVCVCVCVCERERFVYSEVDVMSQWSPGCGLCAVGM